MASELWALVEAHRRRISPATLSNRRIALALGVSPTTVGNWRDGLIELPRRGSILALADLVGAPYERVLDAALRDARFLPEAAAREAEATGDADQSVAADDSGDIDKEQEAPTEA